MSLINYKTKIFADGASLEQLATMADDPRLDGFTTNPTLIKALGVKDYSHFAKNFAASAKGKHVSVEVLSDEPKAIMREADAIASWGPNVWVKVPVLTTSGKPYWHEIERMARRGVKLNVTAVLTLDHVERLHAALGDNPDAIVSVFAGRIADTCVLPQTIVECYVKRGLRTLWASPRALGDLHLAECCGCYAITMTPALLAKLPLVGKNLATYEIETVKMLHGDAVAAGFSIEA